MGASAASPVIAARAAQTTDVGTCPTVAKPLQDVEGKVAFITGGSSGIGLGIAKALSDAGMKVVISYRTKEHLDEALNYLDGARNPVHAIRLDVTDRVGVEAAVSEAIKVFGKVHVLVNNAGVYAMGPLSMATHKDWDWMMNVNLGGVFNCLAAFLPHIRAHGEGGQIVSTASMWGLYAVDAAGIYCASKAAVILLMEALRGELLTSNIGVSIYCPGAVYSRGWNSDRNRPTALAAPQKKTDVNKLVAGEALQRKLRESGASMDPLEAGRFVLQGIRRNDLYILSHPEYEDAIRDRADALLAAIPTNVNVPEARISAERSTLRNPTYSVERDRRRCHNRSEG